MECDRYPRESSGMLRTFLKACKATHVLGLTATPLKLQTGSNGFGNTYSKLVMLTTRNKTGTFFRDILHVTQIEELTSKGYWAKLEYELFDFDTGKLKYNSTGADFTVDSMEAVYKEQGLEDRIIDYIRYSARKSILVAVPSVAQAQALANRIPNSAAVWGDMDTKDRARVVDEFKSLKIRVVIQVNVLSVGFDHPELDCVICGRPTASLSWWYQFVGRATRIHLNKVDALVVDFVGNTGKFGKVEKLQFQQEGWHWKLYGENKILLTGIPITDIGIHTEETERVAATNYACGKVIMPYGKWKGKEISHIPKDYREWMLRTFEWTKYNDFIKKEIERLQNQ